MEHPIQTIGKALLFVILLSIAGYEAPSILKEFGTAEWYLTITVVLLFSILMLTQIYINSNKLSAKIKPNSSR